MKTKLSSKKITQLHADCLFLPMFEGKRSATYSKINEMSDGLLEKHLKNEKFICKAKRTSFLTLPNTPFHKIFLLGLGRSRELNSITLIQSLQHAAQQLQQLNCTTIVTTVDDIANKNIALEEIIKSLVLELANASYRYTATLSKKKAAPLLEELTIQTHRPKTNELTLAIAQGQGIHEGMSLTRHLGNLPSNICTPTYLAAEARKLGRSSKKMTVKVLEERHMEKLNMGAFLSVSRGSVTPGKLVCIEYNNAPKRMPPIVLVGKGITFDTGGISIKPSATMDEMKFDMSGAGTVLGALKACKQMNLPINVVGILACAENMPGGNATKPGDVVETMSGQTVEILNTDAEGRLVLCDALSYAQRYYKPKYIVDLATLTGACVVALGQCAAGLFSNDEGLAKALSQAGEESADRAWQLPIWEDYQEQLDSNFADIANIGGRWGGAITAACFLARFTRNVQWAHLDIAGVAWNTGKAKGATGRPVPLIMQFLIDQAAEI
ncbi:MAG: leucyl aminopeptidase [Candidatus Oxydemutatoraceae bacterium WSBS_2016_MAG_OTU14]